MRRECWRSDRRLDEMEDSGKAKVGLLTLMFDLYDAIPGLEAEMEDFARELVQLFSNLPDVNWPGVCKNRRMVDDAMARFHEEGSDIIVVVLLTYAPSHIALRALRESRMPILVFNTQKLLAVEPGMDPRELIRNHGVHGVQDLANVLNRAGRRFSILTGHYMDPGVQGHLGEWCQAAWAARRLGSLKVGVLGPPLQGMGDFALDHTTLLAKLGVEVHQLSQREVAELAAAAPLGEIDSQAEADREAFKIADEVTGEEHRESLRLEWALRHILSKGSMEAFSANFASIAEEGRLRTLPFLAASKMLRDGYGYAGEGDVLTAIAVKLMHWLCGEASFTEMFTMDFGSDSLLMSHMGESNPDLAREDCRAELVGSTLELAETPVVPILPRFSLRPGRVTLVNLTVSATGGLKMIVSEGDVLDFPTLDGVMTPHYKFRPGKALCAFLTELAREGSSHHFALAYGSRSSQMEKVAEILGIEFSTV
jgi:L-arabinose isomerase